MIGPVFKFDVARDTHDPPTLLLAHGAGAGMDSPFMEAIAHRLAGHGITMARFEFRYMELRRADGKRRPPPRVPDLIEEFRAAVTLLGIPRLIIGGKSMGGRIASMIADDLYRDDRISGCVCLGYPFHPVNQPATLRTAHLAALLCPTLIVQGERDPLGTRAEVPGLPLSAQIQISWLPDGDHDLRPRKASGHSERGNLDSASVAVAGFVRDVGPR